MQIEECVTLDMTCADCGTELVLVEGGEHWVMCPHCPEAEPAKGATPADAADGWLEKHPAPVFLPSSIAYFVPPKHPWVIEVGGYPFQSLTAAEAYARTTGETIYCRLATAEQKAVNDL
jgi:ssDNA-binding Zn-finger/Zn-ribbon topoisomerase 1